MEADMQCPTSPARPISNHTDALAWVTNSRSEHDSKQGCFILFLSSDFER